MKLYIQIEDDNIYDSNDKYGLIYMSSDTLFGSPHRAFEEVTYPDIEGSNIIPKTISEAFTHKFKFAVKTDGDLLSLDNANRKIVSFNSLLYTQKNGIKTIKRITIYDNYRGIKLVGYPMPISKAETFWRDSHGNQGDFAVVYLELHINNPDDCDFNWHDKIPIYPPNGDTEISIEINKSHKDKIFKIQLQTSDPNTICNIKWGDGLSENTTTYLKNIYSHTYNSFGRYKIKISRIEGNGNYNIAGSNNVDCGFVENTYAAKVIKCVLGDNIIITGNGCFANCSSLRHVVISKDITNINTYTFYGCKSLESVLLSNNITTIGGGVFDGCISMVYANVPDKLKYISSSLFYGCYSLRNIIIPSTINTLYYYAFHALYSCEYIELRCLYVPIFISSNVFNNLNINCKIYVRDELLEQYKTNTNTALYANYFYPISEKYNN